MKILITGGAGFIGSALIRHLIAESDHSIINLDKLTYSSNLNSLVGIPKKRYQFIKGDICNKSLVSDIFSTFKPDAVMHLAAESHVDRSIDNPIEFLKTNILGTFELLQASKDYFYNLPIRRKNNFKFHHISTDEVFGDLEENEPAFSEDTNYNPSSPYSASKASSDHLVKAWNRTYGLPIVISNCSNNYGPFQHPEKLIPNMILRCILMKSLPVYGNGEQIRDWLFVEDHVKALKLIVENGVPGSSFNIGGNNEISNLNVVKSICNALQRMLPIDKKFGSYKDLITFVDDRPGHDKRYAINSNKITNEFGWEPLESFESGLEKTVKWYLDNPSFLEDIKANSTLLDRLGKIQA